MKLFFMLCSRPHMEILQQSCMRAGVHQKGIKKSRYSDDNIYKIVMAVGKEEMVMAAILGYNNLNYDYLLKNCYSANRFARKGAGRASFGKADLLSIDSSALEKISKNLQAISYDKDNGKQIFNNAKALIETYNNTVGSADKLESKELERNMKKVKQFVKDHRNVLESVGIKISASGKMELKKEKMLATGSEKMRKVLSGDFAKNMEKYAKKLQSVSKKLLIEEAAKKSREEEKKSMELMGPEFGSASPSSIDYYA